MRSLLATLLWAIRRASWAWVLVLAGCTKDEWTAAAWVSFTPVFAVAFFLVERWHTKTLARLNREHREALFKLHQRHEAEMRDIIASVGGDAR